MTSNLWQGQWQGRNPVGDSHKRARKVISPSGGIIRGKFPSRKNGRMVHHEGLLELGAAYLFEASPKVVRYREQPITICYPDGNRLRRYTPDFELTLTTGKTVLIEVKPVRSLENDEIQHKLNRICEFMHIQERSFLILTDLVIRKEPILSNLQWIYHKSARIPPTLEAMNVAVQRYKSHFPASIKTAVSFLKKSGLDPYSLLLSGHLQCSLTHPISQDSTLQLARESDHDWFWIAQELGF